ncbi:MAG: hypothetical protein ACYDCE_16245 [Candidatus Acidiferrales bacterium]
MPLLTHPSEWPKATKSALTRKIGPLPVWAWAGIVVGVVIVARKVKLPGATPKAGTPVTGTTLLPGTAAGGTTLGSGGGGIVGSNTIAPAPGAMPGPGAAPPNAPPPGGVLPGPSASGTMTNWGMVPPSGLDSAGRVLLDPFGYPAWWGGQHGPITGLGSPTYGTFAGGVVVAPPLADAGQGTSSGLGLPGVGYLGPPLRVH